MLSQGRLEPIPFSSEPIVGKFLSFAMAADQRTVMNCFGTDRSPVILADAVDGSDAGQLSVGLNRLQALYALVDDN